MRRHQLNGKRVSEIKLRMRLGEFVSREDFDYMRLWDRVNRAEGYVFRFNTVAKRRQG